MQNIKRNRGWVIGAIGGGLAVVLLGFGVSRLLNPDRAAADSQATESPTPLPQRVEVVALGRIEPQGEVVRVGGPSGDRIARLLVKQGDEVKSGQVLAVLESYGEQKAQRDLAASQLAEAQARLRASTQYGQAQIAEAQSQVQQVVRPGSFEIRAQEAKIRELQATLALEQVNLQRNQALRAEGAISQQTLDQQITKVRQVQEQLVNAEATLVQLNTAWQEDIRNAQAKLRSQQANLPLTQIQVAVTSAQQNLNLAEAKLDRTLIRAPRDGRVLRVITHAGEAIGNDGVLDLGNTRDMYVVAEVYETDVGLVKIGQPVTVTSRNGAFETPLRGRVAEIGWQVFKNNVLDDDPAANADARVVEVKVKLDSSAPVESLTNLQVDVKINVKE